MRRRLLNRAAVSRQLGRKARSHGHYVYANFGLTCVDDTHIYIGEHTMIGPNCVLATANYPILPELREKAYDYFLLGTL